MGASYVPFSFGKEWKISDMKIEIVIAIAQIKRYNNIICDV